jgi:biopolymer transport protein ExbD
MHHSKSVSQSKVSLPITPMLDLTFQLLFFFVVTFTPGIREGVVDLALPGEQGCQPPPGPEREPEEVFPVDLTVTVRAQLDGANRGEVSALSVRTIDGRSKPVDDLGALTRHLAQLREKLPSNKEGIHVEVDPSLRVGSLARVMDACRRAGFTNVGVRQR